MDLFLMFYWRTELTCRMDSMDTVYVYKCSSFFTHNLIISLAAGGHRQEEAEGALRDLV